MRFYLNTVMVIVRFIFKNDPIDISMFESQADLLRGFLEKLDESLHLPTVKLVVELIWNAEENGISEANGEADYAEKLLVLLMEQANYVAVHRSEFPVDEFSAQKSTDNDKESVYALRA